MLCFFLPWEGNLRSVRGKVFLGSRSPARQSLPRVKQLFPPCWEEILTDLQFTHLQWFGKNEKTKLLELRDNDTWFCFKCATFNRSISGSLQKISVCFLAGQCLIDNVSTYRVHIWFHGWLLRRQNRVTICIYRWDRWDRNMIGIGIYGMDQHL